MVVNTANGIHHVALAVERYGVYKSYDVYLPNGAMDLDEKFYARYLLEHPHPKINIHYTEEDICRR